MSGRRTRRGNVAIAAALMIGPLSLLAALGLDFGRQYLASAQLSQAVDAGALAGARVLGTRDPAAEARLWFDANNPARQMLVTAFSARVSSDGNTLTVAASATIPTTFLKLAGARWRTLPVGASATARRTTYGMELALVLDTTGSMYSNGGSTALPQAAQDLITILFGSTARPDTLFVSIVPFGGTVNIGSNKAHWLTGGAVDQTRYAPFVWRGCVEARTDGEDQTDTPWTTRPLTPFLYASTRARTAAHAWGTTPAGDPVLGDADWGTSPLPALVSETLDPDDSNSLDPRTRRVNSNAIKGPNVGCSQPIAGLTNDRDRLLDIVRNLQFFNRGGTKANIGLQAGWWTLSPRWRGLWGASLWGTTTPDGLPLDYPGPSAPMQKAMVIMTDGDNNWFDYSVAHRVGSVTHTDFQPGPDYTAYGRLTEGRLGTTSAARATTAINDRMLAMCTRIKATGIRIYAVTLGSSVSAASRTLYTNCSSGAGYYFNAPTTTELRSAFREIGSQLANLRLER